MADLDLIKQGEQGRGKKKRPLVAERPSSPRAAGTSPATGCDELRMPAELLRLAGGAL